MAADSASDSAAEDILAELDQIGMRLSGLVRTPDESAIALKSHVQPYSGELPATSGPHFIVILDGAGRFQVDYDGVRFDEDMVPGDMALRLGGFRATASLPRATALQLGIAPDIFNEALAEACGGCDFDLEAVAAGALSTPQLRRQVLQLANTVMDRASEPAEFETDLVALTAALAAEQALMRRPSRERPLSAMQQSRVRQRVNDLVSQPPGISELAALCGFSRSHFSRAFALTFNCTPSSYVQSVRMRRAAAMLRERGHSVLDIALEIGYANPSKFAAAFRRDFGMNPKVWRDV